MARNEMGIFGRRRRGSSVFLVPFFLCFLWQRSEAVETQTFNYTRYRHVSSLRLDRIEKHLDKINKSPVLTIQSPDGDIIDCVHKRKQPALDHPLLKNHKIQRDPPEIPRMKTVKEDAVRDTTMKNSNSSGVPQLWHQNGLRCPKGTVPIRRSTVHDVLRAKSLYDFGKKQRRYVPLDRRVDAPDVVSANGHEHAIAYTGASQDIYGAKATINVWDPSIEMVNEFSLSQIWVLSGSFDGSDLNSIEAGWQVSPELYGDNRPRLFTYWTSDAYQATGCYNLLCSGFVQTNSRIAIGAAISPVSAIDGSQYDITILIWKSRPLPLPHLSLSAALSSQPEDLTPPPTAVASSFAPNTQTSGRSSAPQQSRQRRRQLLVSHCRTDGDAVYLHRRPAAADLRYQFFF